MECSGGIENVPGIFDAKQAERNIPKQAFNSKGK